MRLLSLLVASYCKGPDQIPDQLVWDLWWTKLQSAKSFSLSFIHSSPTLCDRNWQQVQRKYSILLPLPWPSHNKTAKVLGLRIQTPNNHITVRAVTHFTHKCNVNNTKPASPSPYSRVWFLLYWNTTQVASQSHTKNVNTLCSYTADFRFRFTARIDDKKKYQSDPTKLFKW
jgi:hypothetical protein